MGLLKKVIKLDKKILKGVKNVTVKPTTKFVQTGYQLNADLYHNLGPPKWKDALKSSGIIPGSIAIPDFSFGQLSPFDSFGVPLTSDGEGESASILSSPAVPYIVAGVVGLLFLFVLKGRK